MKKNGLLALAAIGIVVLIAVFLSLGRDTTRYIYNTYSAELATNWNPHTWQKDADHAVLHYMEAPLADLTVKDSVKKEHQWIFVAASEIVDVTRDQQEDLIKYFCILPKDKTAQDMEEGYVYEIRLRQQMCWDDGTPINADTYIYSMQQLLNPKMRNYRAKDYFSGDAAIAGAYAYYHQGSPIYDVVVPAYAEDQQPDYSLDLTDKKLFINLSSKTMTFSGWSIYEVFCNSNYIAREDYQAVVQFADAEGYVRITDQSRPAVLKVLDGYCAAFGESLYLDEAKTAINENLYKELLYYDTGRVSEPVSYDTVGLYKADEYTIRYVCLTEYDRDNFLTFCMNNWLVKEDLYERCKVQGENGQITTTYGTSLKNTASYGPYKLKDVTGEEMVFVQNDQYWEYTENKDGTLSSTTFFEVDGKTQPQFMTEKIVIKKMSDQEAKNAFLAGELDDLALMGEDVKAYAASPRRYHVDETYTMRLFFHTALESLQAMDQAGTNVNGVVLSNEKFRKAFSLAIQRSEFVSATAGFKPAFYLINTRYYYDVYQNPLSVYRDTPAAKQSICELYGVSYGEGTDYATLDEAYASITGYDLTKAQALMTEACAELVDAGLYTEGENITIRLALSAAAADAYDLQQVELLNRYINAAVEGSGFGQVQIVPVDNLKDRYADVANGVYAMGRGAWGGAAFYPFNMFRCYCDPTYADLHEAGCYDPTTETLTLTVGDEKVTMTWQQWSTCMVGAGKYADASNEVKLQILSQLEKAFLGKYYCIPLCSNTASSMLSYKTDYFTENYSIMYGFGGMRLMTYNYTNAQWKEFVKDSGGTLSYQE